MDIKEQAETLELSDSNELLELAIETDRNTCFCFMRHVIDIKRYDTKLFNEIKELIERREAKNVAGLNHKKTKRQRSAKNMASCKTKFNR